VFGFLHAVIKQRACQSKIANENKRLNTKSMGKLCLENKPLPIMSRDMWTAGIAGAFGLRNFHRWLGLNDDARLAQW
jgi:hypothetical protein